MQCHGGRYRAARTVTGNSNAVTVDRDFVGVLNAPSVGRQSVLEASWEWRLRRETIVDRQHLHLGICGKVRARSVVGLQVAEDESSTMDEHDQRCWLSDVGWFVETSRNRPVLSCYLDIATGNCALIPERSRSCCNVRHVTRQWAGAPVHHGDQLACGIGRQLKARRQSLAIDLRTVDRQPIQHRVRQRNNGTRHQTEHPAQRERRHV